MLIETGKYRGRITDYGVTQSLAGQKLPTVFVTFELVGRYDPETGEVEPCSPESRTYFKSISPRTIDWLLADLKTIGFDKPGLEYLDPEAPDAADLFGREIDIVCQHETYDGRDRERWSIHRERTREKINRQSLARLDAQFSEKIRRAFGTGDVAVAPPVVTTPDDDTVF